MSLAATDSTYDQPAPSPSARFPIATPPVPRAFSGSQAYGQKLARAFHAESVRAATTSTVKSGHITAVRLSSRNADAGLSAAMPPEKAYAVILQLRASQGAELWLDGARAGGASFEAGSVIISHLASEPRLHLRDAFDFLFVHIPQIVFDEMAERHGARPITGFATDTPATDPVLHDMCRVLLPALDDHDHVSPLFFDHVVFAFYARLAQRYGHRHPREIPRAGALSAAQARLAKDMLADDLTERPSLAAVAAACGLSENRFVRSFRGSTGMPPFRWLRQARVERAKEMLLSPTLSLAQIAYDCGFSDQSHFTRVFSAAVGSSPGKWRQARRS